jgi:hypothetical protein
MDWSSVIWLAGMTAIAFAVWQIGKRWRAHALKRHLRKIVADVNAGRIPATSLEDHRKGVITVTEDGFTVSRYDNVLVNVRWQDLVEIRAYKADLFVVDRICWGFCRTGDDNMVEVHEEMSGFVNLLKVIETRYGIKGEHWFAKVAFPAFAPNMTVIWTKEGGTESDATVDPDARDRR